MGISRAYHQNIFGISCAYLQAYIHAYFQVYLRAYLRHILIVVKIVVVASPSASSVSIFVFFLWGMVKDCSDYAFLRMLF